MLSKQRKEDLYKQGYRLIGNHSAVKDWAETVLKRILEYSK